MRPVRRPWRLIILPALVLPSVLSRAALLRKAEPRLAPTDDASQASPAHPADTHGAGALYTPVPQPLGALGDDALHSPLPQPPEVYGVDAVHSALARPAEAHGEDAAHSSVTRPAHGEAAADASVTRPAVAHGEVAAPGQVLAKPSRLAQPADAQWGDASISPLAQSSSGQPELSQVQDLENRLGQLTHDTEVALNQSREESLRVLHDKVDRNKQVAAEIRQLRSREKLLSEENEALKAKVEVDLGEGAYTSIMDGTRMRSVEDLDDEELLGQAEHDVAEDVDAPGAGDASPGIGVLPVTLMEGSPNRTYIKQLLKEIADTRETADKRMHAMALDFQKYYRKADARAELLNAERTRLLRRVAVLEGRRAALAAALRNGEIMGRMRERERNEAMLPSSQRTGGSQEPIVAATTATGWSRPGTVVAHHLDDEEEAHEDQLVAAPDPSFWSMRRQRHQHHFEKGPPPAQLGPPLGVLDEEVSERVHHKVVPELQQAPDGWELGHW